MNGKATRAGPRDVIGRRALPHDPPLGIDTNNEVFFITICCKTRGTNQLCNPDVWNVMVGATRFYEKNRDWFVPVLVSMPDHLHALASFSREVRMRDVIANWKRYVSRKAKVRWQRDFFDHRLRGDEGWREKAHYILANPVRAGLVEKWEDWPYVLLPW
jgi:putative transposase